MAKIVYVERQPGKFVSIEKVFREIAAGLPDRFNWEFQQLPFTSRVYDIVRNLIFFKAADADIYHITGHVHFMSFRLPPERTVLSIMDVRFVKLNRGVRRWILKKLYLGLPVRRMNYVTTISEQVKREIVGLTGCPPEKIRVLDLPLMSHIEPMEARPFDSAKPRILQIGTMVNKNIPNLVKALKDINCKLVIVGELNDEQRRDLAVNAIDFENYVGLSDLELRSQYAEADIVTFCSTYEGFGLPVIEAQAMRKPVLTSDISPMREVAGEGACLVDPHSVESIRNGILELIADAELRERVVKSGEKNVARFRSQAVSDQYAGLYEEILLNLRAELES